MRSLVAFIVHAGLQFPLVYAAVLTALSGNAAGLAVVTINRMAKHLAADRILFNDGLLFGLALAAYLILLRLALRQANALSERVIESYRLKIVTFIRQAELLPIERLGEEDLYLKLTKDARKVSQAIRKSLRAFESAVIAAFVFGYLLWQHSAAALTVLAFNATAAVLALLSYEILAPLMHAVTNHETRLFGVFTHLLDGFKEIKMDQAKNDELFQRDLGGLTNTVKALRIRLSGLLIELEAVSEALYYLSIGSALFLFTADVPASVRFEVIALVLFLWSHLYRIYEMLPAATAASVSVERLEQLAARLRSGAGPVSLSRPMEPIRQFRELLLENLVFHYTDAAGNPTYTVGPVTLALHPGEILYLRGANGSGKTTLLKLLTGLYPPFSGTFKMDGVEIRMAEHRELFAAIFTDFHLFDRLYGLAAIPPKRIRSLLRQMELEPQTHWRRGRFTQRTLSPGQRKRLALITVMLADKPVYVFDEWAAEQEPHFRAYFYEKLLPTFKAQGKTLVVVTHDERYFHLADRLAIMQDGKLLAEVCPPTIGLSSKWASET